MFAFLTAGLAAAKEQEQKGGLDSCARAELKRMGEFLGRQGAFTVHTKSTLEREGTTKASEGDVALRRPDRLRVERRGDLGSVRIYYDGKSFSVMGLETNVYATAPAAPAVDSLLDDAADALGWIPPAADFLYSQPYEVLVAEAKTGRCLEPESLGQTKLKHVVFEGPAASWELWIEDSVTPVPRKLVVTPKDDPRSGKYSVVLSGWDLEPQLSDSFFTFNPPEGATRVSFLAPRGRKGGAQP